MDAVFLGADLEADREEVDFLAADFFTADFLATDFFADVFCGADFLATDPFVNELPPFELVFPAHFYRMAVECWFNLMIYFSTSEHR